MWKVAAINEFNETYICEDVLIIFGGSNHGGYTVGGHELCHKDMGNGKYLHWCQNSNSNTFA